MTLHWNCRIMFFRSEVKILSYFNPQKWTVPALNFNMLISGHSGIIDNPIYAERSLADTEQILQNAVSNEGLLIKIKMKPDTCINGPQKMTVPALNLYMLISSQSGIVDSHIYATCLISDT